MSNTNTLIEALTPAAQDQLLSAARLMELPQPMLLAEAGRPTTHVYFLTEGVASFVVSVRDGGSAEIGMAGREGIVGVTGLIGSDVPVANCLMQTDGAGYRLTIADMQRLFQSSAEIRTLVLQSMQQQMTALSQIAACNRLHQAAERLARWLLTAADRLGSETVCLTQESVSQMLGTRRTTVALVAGELQRRGMIRYQRGRVHIVDRPGLTHAACDCYGITRKLVDDLYRNPFTTQ